MMVMGEVLGVERCDGCDGGVRRCWKVWQLSGSLTVLRRFVSWLGGAMVMGRRKKGLGRCITWQEV